MINFTPLQEKIIQRLANSSLRDVYYLTGGTLLAVRYLHHRLSKDLDFFSDEPVVYRDVRRFIDQVVKEEGVRLLEEHKIYDRWEFVLRGSELLRVEFVCYDFPSLRLREKWRGIWVDSLDDIAANKTMALIDRNEPKDLFDLYFLITKKGYTVTKLYELMKEKFGVSFAESLLYSEFHKVFERMGELQPYVVAEEGREVIERVVEYFTKESEEFLRREIG